MRYLSKFLFSLVFALSIFFLCTNQTYAATCDSTTVTFIPNPPYRAGESITIIAEGCNVGASFGVGFALLDDNFATNFSVHADADGLGRIEATAVPPKQGTYVVSIGDYFGVVSYEGEIQVEAPTNPIVYQCGDVVPDGTPTCTSSGGLCCPATCPWEILQEPGTYNDVSICGCGAPGRSCCPASSGVSPCYYSTLNNTFCNADNICEEADSSITVRQCGEILDDPTNEVCVAECPVTLYEDDVYWCACGQDGGTCCGGSTSEQCVSDGYVCNANNFCTVPYAFIDVAECPDGTDGIDTAIGCFNFGSINFMIANLIRFFVGMGGGITLFFLAYSAFIIMTSAGNPKMIAQGKQLLITSVSALFMFALSTLILRVIGVNILGLF